MILSLNYGFATEFCTLDMCLHKWIARSCQRIELTAQYCNYHRTYMTSWIWPVKLMLGSDLGKKKATKFTGKLTLHFLLTLPVPHVTWKLGALKVQKQDIFFSQLTTIPVILVYYVTLEWLWSRPEPYPFHHCKKFPATMWTLNCL